MDPKLTDLVRQVSWGRPCGGPDLSDKTWMTVTRSGGARLGSPEALDFFCRGSKHLVELERQSSS